MLQYLNPDPSVENVAHVSGTVDELVKHFQESERTEDFGVYIAGLMVADLSAEGKHDGQPAVRLTLADSMGAREVGRLVLQSEPDGGFREELPEWDLYFVHDGDRDPWLERQKTKTAWPSVMTIELDMSYAEDTLEEAIAGMSAEWGVSLKVVNPSGPGGGWPIIEFTGKTENLERMLRGAYGMDDDEVSATLGSSQ